MKKQTVPRGIRNNNPLNIRIGNTWLGEVQDPTDPDFEQFVNMKYGLRAAFVLLRRYICHYHRDTIPAVISAWAPPTENWTQTYIDKVCALTQLTPEAKLDYFDRAQMVKLVDAMCQVENGQPLSLDLIEQAYAMA